MKHAGCPLCSRAGFMKVGGAGGEGLFFFFWLEECCVTVAG